MSALAHHLPPDDVPDMPVDEVAMRLLRLISEPGRGAYLNRNNVGLIGMWDELQLEPASSDPFLRSVVEAWDWLEHRGLVAMKPGGGNWAYVTTRGEAVAADAEGLAAVRATARLDVEMHPLIATAVRRQFILGEYGLAAFAAMRAVEIRVRELAKATESDVGVKLMQKALGAGGALRDESLDPGEQEATMFLFWGAIGVFKNPSSHRQVDFDDPTLAAEVVLFADLLVRMLDRAPPAQ
jgi:uncharacterized protein (TIGR02391 family)